MTRKRAKSSGRNKSTSLDQASNSLNDSVKATKAYIQHDSASTETSITHNTLSVKKKSKNKRKKQVKKNENDGAKIEKAIESPSESTKTSATTRRKKKKKSKATKSGLPSGQEDLQVIDVSDMLEKGGLPHHINETQIGLNEDTGSPKKTVDVPIVRDSDNLQSNADFISFQLSDEDYSSESEEEHVLQAVSKKLSTFVADSTARKDDSSKKRKRNGNDLAQTKRRKSLPSITTSEGPYPWVNHEKYQREEEPARILHKELEDFVKYVGPTRHEHIVRQFVISRVKNLVETKWPTARLQVFGSFETKLYLPTSDIDMVVLSTDPNNVYEKATHLRKLANWLIRSGISTLKDMQVITGARVPIIKFVDAITGIHVDISFNKPGGLVTAAVVKRYAQAMPALRPLVIFIKHFLNMRGMNEVFMGGLGSYSIICMVISFLQMHPKIASKQVNQAENLGVLCVEFFELYGKRFNYDIVGISINEGGKYFSKIDYGWTRPGQPYLLSIEDPTEPDNDIAKSSFGILKVKSTFGGGYDFLVQRLYDVNDAIKDRRRGTGEIGDSILSSVVSIDEDIKASRQQLSECFENPEVQEYLKVLVAEDGSASEGEILEDEEPHPATITRDMSSAHELKEKEKKRRMADDEFVIDESDPEDDLLDNDGRAFVRPKGYQKPSMPGQVDDLYSRLNANPVDEPSTISEKNHSPVDKGRTENGKDENDVYLIESSDNELARKSEAQNIQQKHDSQGIIAISSDEEDSKTAQIGKSARLRYWEKKGKSTDKIAGISSDDENSITM